MYDQFEIAEAVERHEIGVSLGPPPTQSQDDITMMLESESHPFDTSATDLGTALDYLLVNYDKYRGRCVQFRDMLEGDKSIVEKTMNLRRTKMEATKKKRNSEDESSARATSLTKARPRSSNFLLTSAPSSASLPSGQSLSSFSDLVRDYVAIHERCILTGRPDDRQSRYHVYQSGFHPSARGEVLNLNSTTSPRGSWSSEQNDSAPADTEYHHVHWSRLDHQKSLPETASSPSPYTMPLNTDFKQPFAFNRAFQSDIPFTTWTLSSLPLRESDLPPAIRKALSSSSASNSSQSHPLGTSSAGSRSVREIENIFFQTPRAVHFTCSHLTATCQECQSDILHYSTRTVESLRFGQPFKRAAQIPLYNVAFKKVNIDITTTSLKDTLFQYDEMWAHDVYNISSFFNGTLTSIISYYNRSFDFNFLIIFIGTFV